MIGVFILGAVVVATLLGIQCLKLYGGRWRNNPSKAFLFFWAVTSIIFWAIILAYVCFFS